MENNLPAQPIALPEHSAKDLLGRCLFSLLLLAALFAASSLWQAAG